MTAATPEHLVSRLAQASATPERADEETRFWDYLRLEEYHTPRPKETGVRLKTAQNIERSLFQIYTDIGYDLPPRRLVNRLREATDPCPVPLLPWETTPPPWEAILRWRDSKPKAMLESQQKSLKWIGAFWGQSGDKLPRFVQTTWATSEAVHRAQQAGIMRKHNRFLELPTAIQTLLASTPFETKLKTGRQWRLGLKRAYRSELLRDALYKDHAWRTWVFTDFYHGARISEMTTLRIPMFQPNKGGIIGWPQPKKGMAPRDVITRGEDWTWTSKVDPSIQAFLTHWRPKVANEHSGDHVFLNTDGAPWTIDGARNFIREGMEVALGDHAAGPHSLRRACATWRYLHGWDIEEIALFLDDTTDVIESSYIDWNLVKRVGRKNERSRTTRPSVPLVRSNRRQDARQRDNSTPTLQTESAALRHEEKVSAPAGKPARVRLMRRQLPPIERGEPNAPSSANKDDPLPFPVTREVPA